MDPPTPLPNFISEAANSSTSSPNDFVKQTEFVSAIPAIASETVPATPQVPPKDLKLFDEDLEKSVANALSPITQGSSLLLGWAKDTLKSTVQKAKSSVDLIVTTLDPQMKDYINATGEVEIIVTSDKEDKIYPVRDGFQVIFGRAVVDGIASQAKTIAAQPVGFESALRSAEQRMTNLREDPAHKDKVLISVENFIVEAYKNEWFDVGLLLLSDPVNNITLKSFTQMTSLPFYLVAIIESDTPVDYEFKSTGFSTTVGSHMSRNLNCHHAEWHQEYTSIERSDMILNAARSLASVYKLELSTALRQTAK